jgi:hypothetical protein
MDLCLRFPLRFGFKNKVLKPCPALLNLSRNSFTQDSNLITLFTKYYQGVYFELRLIDNSGKYEFQPLFTGTSIILRPFEIQEKLR